jgi:hypothetical protein
MCEKNDNPKPDASNEPGSVAGPVCVVAVVGFVLGR